LSLQAVRRSMSITPTTAALTTGLTMVTATSSRPDIPPGRVIGTEATIGILIKPQQEEYQFKR
jgi:hypothetical protein